MSAPTFKTFDMDDLDRELSDQDRLVMAETILAWADLDTGISRLIFLVFGIQDDAGSILIGNMDLKTKVEKIKLLHDHHGHASIATNFAKLATAMKGFSECRNFVAHRKCIGRLRSDPNWLAFMSSKHVKKVPGKFEIVCVNHAQLVASAKFARDAAVQVGNMIHAIESGKKDRANR